MKNLIFLTILSIGCCHNRPIIRHELSTRIEVKHEHWNNHSPVTLVVENKYIR